MLFIAHDLIARARCLLDSAAVLLRILRTFTQHRDRRFSPLQIGMNYFYGPVSNTSAHLHSILFLSFYCQFARSWLLDDHSLTLTQVQ